MHSEEAASGLHEWRRDVRLEYSCLERLFFSECVNSPHIYVLVAGSKTSALQLGCLFLTSQLLGLSGALSAELFTGVTVQQSSTFTLASALIFILGVTVQQSQVCSRSYS